jgi:hypothetical protein
MHFLRRSMTTCFIVNAICLHAQFIGTVGQSFKQPPRIMKPENGMVISWMSGIVADSKVNQVDIFDEQGHRLAGLNVLRPVEEATCVSIYDVSARRGSIIAVAAVFASMKPPSSARRFSSSQPGPSFPELSKGSDGSLRMASSLMTFDFSGRLLSAFVLEPPQDIRKLEVDENANIWTLTDNDGDNAPATVPLIVEYSAGGTVISKLLTRNQFPFHAHQLKESLSVGRISMGYDSGILWVWLPGSTDLISVSTADGTSSVLKTQMPKRANYTEFPLSKFIREPSGDLIAEFREDSPKGDHDLAYFRWSSSQKSWSQFKPGMCDGQRLEGISGDKQIYLRYATDHTDICSFQ